MDQLHVRINSPERIIWEGQAESVSAINSHGTFDILPLHANFITIIENKPIKIKTSKEAFEFTFTKSVMYIHKNDVLIYTNI